MTRATAEGMRFGGIFCVTDALAIGSRRGLADAGIRVPDEVKVYGFDGITEAGYTVPSLSTVAPDCDVMARTAVELLLVHIDDRAGMEATEFAGPFAVMDRESTSAR
ncbi:substrate-binding domain-containing protein [Streptomyces bottropensis]|uniref:substrate-binding domain-containing protein n=1 Tax=Streptomyces bottropensis TaxID=42235 RepID=UPI0037B69491